jgi:cysteine synthase A
LIRTDVASTVGDTPMVDLGRLGTGLPGRVVAKLEMRNPCGSVNDRVGVAMIENAERRGVLRRGMTLIEPTGGNTGIALAFAAAIRGYRLVLTMPASMSTERVALLRHLGAEVVLTPGILMTDAVARARQLVEEAADSLMLDQFTNPANPEVHRRTTAVAVWEDCQHQVDVFVSAVGTGGTITGRQGPQGARPAGAHRRGRASRSGAAVGRAGDHLMPGIGVGFIPDALNRSLIDEIVVVGDEEAFESTRRLAREEGILAGVSSGAAIHAALSVASRSEFAGKTVVVLFADAAERYVTTSLFASDG